MKIFSENRLILSTALLMLTGMASAGRLNIENIQSSASVGSHDISYTASGKTDKKTAQMFKNLLQNSRNLQVHAEVTTPVRQPVLVSRQSAGNTEVSVNYTIRGKTTMDTVRRLKRLFENHEYVEVMATAKVRMSAEKYQQLLSNSGARGEQNWHSYTQHPNQFVNPYIGYQPSGYQPVYYPANYGPTPVNFQGAYSQNPVYPSPQGS